MRTAGRAGQGLLGFIAWALVLAGLPPGAAGDAFQGFGATTPGGAGGAIVRVTTLDDSGPGSLREAIAGGNRTVVFDVAGSIVLAEHLFVGGAFVTIDGFSAPPPGITLVGRGLVIRGINGAHDVIVRGLRVRDSIADNIQVAYGAYNVVISHVSSHGAGDGNLDITYDSHDVTVAWSLFTAPLSAKSMLIKYGASRVTLHHNAFVDSPTRNPAAGVDDAGTEATDTTLDMRNNLVWNWGIGYGTFIHHGARANVVANFYSSPASPLSEMLEALVVCRGECFGGDPTSVARGHVAGNVSADPIAVDLNAETTEATPFPASPVDTADACTAAHEVLAGAGVRPLDALDSTTLMLVALPPCVAAPTQTTVAVAPSPSHAGQAVALVASVAAQEPGAGEPTGTVTFRAGADPVGTAQVVSGAAALMTSALPVGTHDVTATYEGGPGFAASAGGPVAHVVLGQPTSTSLVSSLNPSRPGQRVTFTAGVTADGSGPPGGTVQFLDGSTVLATVTMVNGTASFKTGKLSRGAHVITAAYAGGGAFAPSTSEPITQMVQKRLD
jgi:hypothetical protein